MSDYDDNNFRLYIHNSDELGGKTFTLEPVPPTKSKKAEWPFPSHRDRRWVTPQTVYGAPEAGLEYVDDDRLSLWDSAAARRGRAAAEAVVAKSRLKRRTAAWWEIYLTAYYERQVELVHALAGVNWSSGHPVYSLGFRFVEEVAGES